MNDLVQCVPFWCTQQVKGIFLLKCKKNSGLPEINGNFQFCFYGTRISFHYWCSLAWGFQILLMLWEFRSISMSVQNPHVFHRKLKTKTDFWTLVSIAFFLIFFFLGRSSFSKHIVHTGCTANRKQHNRCNIWNTIISEECYLLW